MAEAPDGGTVVAPETGTPVSQEDESLLSVFEKTQKEEAAVTPPAKDEGINADLVKQLEALDISKLPQGIREKLELPFKQDYTKKTQALADDRRKVEEEYRRGNETVLSLIDRLTKAQGHEATPDQKQEILQRIRDGETELVDKLIEMRFNETVGPKVTEMSKREAIADGARRFPALPEYEAEVAEVLKQDPDLLRLASRDNFKDAGIILAGLGIQAHARKLQSELETYKAGEAERNQKYLEEWKARVRKLPTSTSRAGNVSGEEGSKISSFREAADEAWQEQQA